MQDLRKTALEDVLDAFASSEPLPGGGSAAALTGSLGVSLLLMVAGMAKTRTGVPEETSDLAAAAARLRPVREDLIALVDEDSRAYQGVIAAYRQPRRTEEERSARSESVQRAMRGATEVPLLTMRLCERAMREAPQIVRTGNPNAATDAAVGTRLLLAAVESAGLNVDVNLAGVTDGDYVAQSSEARRALEASARLLAEQVRTSDQ
jgi:glutamate formiminotransferase/formiminotetrahydrofolate cyclodeaminase